MKQSNDIEKHGHQSQSTRERIDAESRAGPAKIGNVPLRLQQILGNRAVGRLIERQQAFRKMRDPLEIEADQMAASVLRRTDHGPFNQAAADKSTHTPPPTSLVDFGLGDAAPAEIDGPDVDTSQTKPALSTPPAEPPPDSPKPLHTPTNGLGGRPLTPSMRRYFEPRFGYDLSHVRIVTDQTAEQLASDLKARAFTFGPRIVFNKGLYMPQSNDGKHLLAHELSHVVQQARPGAPRQPMIQRQALDPAPSPTTASAGTAAQAETMTGSTPLPSLIVEDTVAALAPGQMYKSDFLTRLRMAVCDTAEEILVRVGRRADDCPYLAFYLEYYNHQDSRHLERALHKYVPEASEAAAARDYIPMIEERVRRAVHHWVQTGRVTGIPEDAPRFGEPVPSPGTADSPDAPERIDFFARSDGPRRSEPPAMIRARLGRGRPLESSVKGRMESAFGTSFSNVRVHADAGAGKMAEHQRARAFTVGGDIAFGSRQYRPGTLIGDALIAHELAHVVQQRDASERLPVQTDGGGRGDAFLEDDANRSAKGAVVSLWGRGRVALAGLARNAMPRLRSGLRLQRCTADVEPDNEPEVFFTREHHFNGDLFRVESTWFVRETPRGRTIHTLGVDVDYIGDGRADRVQIHGSQVFHNYVGPAPNPRVAEIEEGHIVVDVFGDGAHTVEVEDNMFFRQQWSPPARLHVFTMYFDNEEFISRVHDVRVLSPNAVPVPEGSSREPEQLEAQAEDALVSMGTGIRDIDALLAVAIAEVRFFKDDETVGPGTIEGADLDRWEQLVSVLLTHRTQLSRSSIRTEDEENLRRKIERTMQFLRLTRNITGNLQTLRESSGYIEDIAEQADTLIQNAIAPYHQATLLAFDQPQRAFTLLQEAQQATMALPYNVASLYVQQGQGVYQFSSDVGELRLQIDQARRLAGLNRGDRPIYEHLELDRPGIPVGEAAITDRADRLRRLLFQGTVPGQNLLQQVMEHVQYSQHRLAIFAVLALLNQFRYFKHELNGITGDVLDVLGRDLEDVCDGYITRINAWVDRAEPVWAPGTEPQTRRSVMNGVASEFSAMVGSEQFTQDIEGIQERLETIAVIEMVAKVVAIVVASALVANVAGAAMAATLEGVGVGGAAAWGIVTFTEALAFTFTSRLGNQLVFGGNETSFVADLALNFVLFSYIKGANTLYTRILARLSLAEQAALQAGRSARALQIAGRLGRSGITHGAFTFGALQAFAEVHFLITHRETMGFEERIRSLFTNATIVVVLGLGRHLQTRLTQRVQDPIRRFFSRRYARQLEALEAERQAVVRLMAEVEGGNQARAGELAQRIQALNEAEVRMISRAEGAEGVTGEMLAAELARYQRALEDAESALAQSGVELAGGRADLFRRLGDGMVAYNEGGAEIARLFFENQGGRFEAGDRGLFVGRLGAETVTFVPDSMASRFGLMETARARTANLADAMSFVRSRLSPRALRGLEEFAREASPEETFERLAELERAGENVESHLEGLIAEATGEGIEVTRPERPEADTDPAAYLESMEAYLDRVSRGLPAGPGMRIRTIAELGLRGDLRFQLIVRVMDPLANSAARRAAARAQRAADADAPGSSNFISEYNRIVAEMRNILRDSEISVETKRAALQRLVGELESLVNGNQHIPRNHPFRFDDARTAVNTLSPENFGDVLRVSSAGAVMRGEQSMGSFRSLLNQVVETNYSMADRGILQELVVAVGEPGRGGYRDIMIVSRPVADPAQPRSESPVEPLPPDMQAGGIILDIGAGTSAFALEMVPEAVRQGAMVVQTEHAPTSFDPGLLRADLGPHFNAIPRRDGRSVAVFGDPLQNMGLLYGPDSIRLMFINHVNARYDASQYLALARNLMRVMQEVGRVEVQWDTSLEPTRDGRMVPRGHITGPDLQTALDTVSGEFGREFTVNASGDPITEYDYSITPSRYRGGPRGSTDITDPVPEHRWIFTFGPRFVGPVLPTMPAPEVEEDEFDLPEYLRRD